MCRYNRVYHVSGFSVSILNSISPFSALLLRIKQTCFKACISLMILKKNKSTFWLQQLSPVSTTATSAPISLSTPTTSAAATEIPSSVSCPQPASTSGSHATTVSWLICSWFSHQRHYLHFSVRKPFISPQFYFNFSVEYVPTTSQQQQQFQHIQQQQNHNVIISDSMDIKPQLITYRVGILNFLSKFLKA